jgi:hypothetical protein
MQKEWRKTDKNEDYAIAATSMRRGRRALIAQPPAPATRATVIHAPRETTWKLYHFSSFFQYL